MPRLVTKFKYLKPGTGGRSVGGYARYIATREGAERIDDSHRHAPATQKQQALIEKILRDFPDTKQSHEYRDYQQERTVGNASEFISMAMEENLDAVRLPYPGSRAHCNTTNTPCALPEAGYTEIRVGGTHQSVQL